MASSDHSPLVQELREAAAQAERLTTSATLIELVPVLEVAVTAARAIAGAQVEGVLTADEAREARDRLSHVLERLSAFVAGTRDHVAISSHTGGQIADQLRRIASSISDGIARDLLRQVQA